MSGIGRVSLPRKSKRSKPDDDTELPDQHERDAQHYHSPSGSSDKGDEFKPSNEENPKTTVTETTKKPKRRKLTAQEKQDRAEQMSKEKEERAERNIPKSKVQMRAEMQEKDDKVREYREKVTDMSQKLAHSENQRQTIGKELKVSQVMVQRLTENAYRKADKSKQQNDPDDIVEDRFRDIFDSVSSFAKQRAASPADVGGEEIAKFVEQYYHEHDLTTFASGRMRKAIRRGRVSPRVVLEASINVMLVTRVFEEPFQFLESHEHGRVGLKWFEWLLSMAEKRDPVNGFANTRAHAMAICAPPAHVSGEAQDISHDKELTEMKNKHSWALTKQLLTHSKRILVSGDTQDTKGEKILEGVFRKAIDLSCRLAIQCGTVSFRFLRGMALLKYAKAHARFRQHPACKIDEQDDENDKSKSALHGNRLDMVIQPLVLRVNNGTIGRDNPERVLVRALVWLVKDEDVAEKIR